ncbi:hypothetical protein QVD17_21024 [Tagetes erecta]|uniref:UspA domain-containing protein n=1 Tax=Tagetes erecta TaxID=13708 RepID=A0AAD8KMB4_TARER|nr:hypothetical protein QVD17_21024 [Tagetes erecta]
MLQTFISTGHVITPATRATSSSTVFLRHPPSNNHLLPPTNHRRQLKLRSLTTPIKNSNNFSIDLKSGTGMSGFLEVEFDVRDYELDQYGVVNNAIYANYCQHSRRQLMEKIGINIDTIAHTGNAVALSELSIKYIAPLRIGDKFVVRVRISDTSAARVYFEHFIFKIPNEEPILEARATVVWLDKSYRPIRIPPDVRSRIVQFIRHDMAEEVFEAATMEGNMKNKVMVAIDESEYSQYALKWALETLASTIADCEVVIYTARAPVDIGYLYASSWGTAELIKELKENDKKAALDLLNKAKATCADYGITAEGMTEIGDPKVAICNAIEKLNIQLLVVGSHGRGAVTRAFLGSVSNYCVNHAKCPVLVVKKAD